MISAGKVPFHRPSIGEDEVREVVDVLRSGWLTTGERTRRFEDEFRQYTGCKYALAVNSCTAGLHLALAARDIGHGDEVITSPMTFCATVNVILHTGATPVLADILPDGNMNPESLARRITRRTRAVMPVHMAGLPCRMDEIWAIAQRHSLRVIEDAAHAAGARYGESHVGAAAHAPCSDAVAYSFYATKNMTTGEGGMVTTNDEELAQRMRRLALHGISTDAWNRYSDNGNWHYSVLEAGFKYNLSDVQSAVGLHQLRKLEAFTARRAELAAFYTRRLAALEEVETPPDSTAGRHAWHLYVLRLNLDKLAISRDEFVGELRRRGVATSVHFIPIPLHPFFDRWANRRENFCPVALEQYRRILSLPLFPAMTEEEADYASAAVVDVVATHRRSRPVATPRPAA